jgi:hypothetical protein
MLESFTGCQKEITWNDFIAVFLKDEKFAVNYPRRIKDSVPGHTNGLMYGSTELSNYSLLLEDQKLRPIAWSNRRLRMEWRMQLERAKKVADRMLNRA